MKPLRYVVAGLMLLSGVTHSADFLFAEPSASNTPTAAVFGVCFLVIGLFLLRPGRLTLWFGAIVDGIGAILGSLIVLLVPEPLPIFHAAINWIVFGGCSYLLFQGEDPLTRSTASRVRTSAIIAATVLPGAFAVLLVGFILGGRDPFLLVYDENCSLCHGENLEGMPLGPALVGGELTHGSTVAEVSKSISDGFVETGMPAWSAILTDEQIRGLAILITERRAGYGREDFKVESPLIVPTRTIESERHDYRLETVTSGLHPLPFSIAPLPDGRILVTEKTRGLSIIGTDGTQSELIVGTPPTHDDGIQLPPQGLVNGVGWMLEVATHPDYADNGWIYLHFGDRCSDCDTSMNKLIRGRIRDGQWIDQETIWQAAPETYSAGSDMGRGGRISFDDRGHVFISVGMKGNSNYLGPQDLGLPYGKIHRVHDDGRIPADNPFIAVADALPSTWTYGHRSPQGLEFDPATGRLWGTEMGPRGGDEFNLLRPGLNYGWPLTSKGLDYDGTPVEYGKQLGIVPDMAAIEQPVLDMTPAPSISSFVIYRGDAFPQWQHDVIVGTLKATELYRWVLDQDRVVHTETLVSGLGRIRDVEIGPAGNIYLLIEHAAGGQIVRLVRD
jgi:glucose/arabinose dehydrogenase